MLEAKIIRRGTSPWGSPIHLVKKKQPGQYRLTIGFRALNTVTDHDSYPLPFLNDFTNSLHDCKIFSLIDFEKCFSPGSYVSEFRRQDLHSYPV